MLRVQCVHNKCTCREQGLITVSFAIMYTIVCVSTICTALPNRELLQRSKAGLYKLSYHVERSFINKNQHTLHNPCHGGNCCHD